MRWLARAGAAALSWPSLLLAAVSVALALYTVDQRAKLEGSNGWDALLTHLANLQLVPLLLAVGWVPALVRRHRSLSREEILLRRGSWRRATASVLADDAAALTGALALSVVASLVVCAPLGYGPDWSRRTLQEAASGSIELAASPASAAGYGTSPAVAVGVQMIWLFCGLLAYAAAHLALLVRWGASVAHPVLIGVAVYGVLSGAGLFGARAFPDTSAWLNALWAWDRPASVAITALVWVGAVLGLVAAVRHADSHVPLPRGTGAAAAVVGSVAMVLLFAWAALPEPAYRVPGQLLEAAFGGQHSSLVGHVVSLLPLFGAVTCLAVRLSESDGGRIHLILLRRGSTLRWFVPAAGRGGLLLLTTTALTVTAALALDAALTGGGTSSSPSAFAAGPWPSVGLLAGAYLLVGCCLAALMLLLFWARGTVQEWPLALLAWVLLSYPLITPRTEWNPLAAHSVEPGTPPAPQMLVPPALLLLVLGLVLAVVMRRHRVPGER